MWMNYRAVIAGSGSAAFAEPSVCDLVVKMARKALPAHAAEKPIRVAYLGTATYDAHVARAAQTSQLESRGCAIVDVNVSWPSETKPTADLRALIMSCDVILVSGGNTLYALRRWQECGVTAILREAADAGKLLAGGSAGAICWFDGGHSDSADPASFRPSKVKTNAGPTTTSAETAPPVTPDWKYIRVSALGFFPGLVCPHHDRTQSNGSPRYLDFDEMLSRHRGERGVGIDHWCVVVIEAGSYELFAVPEKPGSVLCNSLTAATESVQPTFVTDGSGLPGVWVKEGGAMTAAPRAGRLDELLRAASFIEPETEMEDEVMRRNPTAEEASP